MWCLWATQEPIEFAQFSALAFPPDPAAFAPVPDTLAVQQQETVAARRRSVSLVQPCDAFLRGDQ